MSLVLYDTLKLQSKYADGWSKWIGGDGTVYIFKHMNGEEPCKPVAQVYRGRHFLTGLFKGKRADEFTGDIKEAGKRTFLVFRIESAETIKLLKDTRPRVCKGV